MLGTYYGNTNLLLSRDSWLSGSPPPVCTEQSIEVRVCFGRVIVVLHPSFSLTISKKRSLLLLLHPSFMHKHFALLWIIKTTTLHSVSAISVKDGGSSDILGGHHGMDKATPSKLNKLRYSGYSAEFLDRVEPNGNIPHKHTHGECIATDLSFCQVL